LRFDERGDESAQKHCQPAQQQAKVVAGGGEDDVDAIAVASFEVVAVPSVVGLEMAGRITESLRKPGRPSVWSGFAEERRRRGSPRRRRSLRVSGLPG